MSIEKEEKVIAFHWGFVGSKPGTVIRQQDGKEIPTTPGTVEVYDGKEPPELCQRGLHGSEKLYDSLTYAEGCVLRKVEISGDIRRGEDKLTGRKRVTIWAIDLTAAQIERAKALAAYAEEIAALAEKKINGTITEEEEELLSQKVVEDRLKRISLEPIERDIKKAGLEL